jgi:hypothetical protein
MGSSLPIQRLINVSVNLTPQPAQMQNLNNLLILGASDIINVFERLRNYNSITQVAADFGTTSPEYLAAVLWFEQSPQPTVLSIGRWAQTATAGKLLGATLSAAGQAIAAWNAITTPGFLANIDGIPYAISPASFAAQTNLNGVAAAIQTALAASEASTTCVWNSVYNRFEFESGTTGIASSFNYTAASAAVGNAAFSGQPAPADTLTLGGTAITFVSALTTGIQCLIGTNLAATLANLATLVNGSADVNLVKFKAVVNPLNIAVYFVAKTPGIGGNSLTMAKLSTVITLTNMAGATASDISVMLAATATSSGAYVAAGIAAESAAASVAIFDNMFGQGWYALQMPTAVDADHLNVAAYIEAATNKHYYGVTTQEPAVLVATDTTNIAYKLQQLNYNRTMVQYSSSNPYAVASALARMLTTNYNGNNTVIALMYKQEPGITAETLAASQVSALESFNANVFLAYNNNTAIFEQGTSASGNFIDTVMGTDWLALDIQTSVYNLLYTSPNKIPQTDAGNGQIANTIESVCSQGVTNGLLAPGVWQSNGFGSLNTGDFLAKGFYVYTPPIASQSSTLRATRASVVFQVAAKLAGAIQTVNVIINVNR